MGTENEKPTPLAKGIDEQPRRSRPIWLEPIGWVDDPCDLGFDDMIEVEAERNGS